MEGATEDPDPGRKEPVKSEKKAPKTRESGRGKGRKRGKLQLAPKVPCSATTCDKKPVHGKTSAD